MSESIRFAPCFAATAWLARLGWRAELGRIFPLIPEACSAHEGLEALVRAETGGGVGKGPLAILAREAAAQWGKGRES